MIVVLATRNNLKLYYRQAVKRKGTLHVEVRDLKQINIYTQKIEKI